MRLKNLYALLLLGFTTIFVTNVEAASSDTGTANKFIQKKIPLFDYLASVSPRLGCYYTVEVMLSSSGSSSFDDVTVIDNKNVVNVKTLVAELNKELKKAVVVQDNDNPHIIHLIDVSLKNISDYPLGLKTDVTYKGPLIQLPDELGKQLNLNLYTQRVFTSPFMSSDFKTQVKYTAKDKQIRDILTNCVPLSNYNNYVWLSQTYTVKDKKTTVIYYYGTSSGKRSHH